MNAGVASLEHLSARSRRERLTTMLIFALLAHGIILLGIGFKSLAPAHAPGTTVNITVATTKSADAPRDADYLARFNQLGPGNTTVHVPVRPQAAGLPFSQAGFNPAEQLAQLFPNPVVAKAFDQFQAPTPPLRQRLITTTSATYHAHRQLVPSRDKQRRAVSLRFSPPTHGRPDQLALSAVELPQLYGPRPKDDARSVNARSALYAPYLLEWQRRIERVGTAQFAKLVPKAIKRGHLTLTVTLASDGSVDSISIVKRSQHPELDAAALRIIRLAAPFAPFPPELRAHTGKLNFTYRWNFHRHSGQGALGLGGH